MPESSQARHRTVSGQRRQCFTAKAKSRLPEAVATGAEPLLVVAASLVVGLAHGPAAAAPPQEAAGTQAQVLFDAGKALMAQKRFSEACPQLEQSQRIQPGGGTLMFLALCHEGEGKTATASSAWPSARSPLVALKGPGRPTSSRPRRW